MQETRSDPGALLSRIPVVAGLAYIERVRQLPHSFTATLAVEPENRYFRHAIAVLASGGKVGYLAPEVAVGIFERVKMSPEPITCPGRCASRFDHENSGVELLLDFSDLPLAAAP